MLRIGFDGRTWEKPPPLHCGGFNCISDIRMYRTEAARRRTVSAFPEALVLARESGMRHLIPLYHITSAIFSQQEKYNFNNLYGFGGGICEIYSRRQQVDRNAQKSDSLGRGTVL